jgi:hypothetical protein
MAVMELHNDTADWLTVRIRTDCIGDELAFHVTTWVCDEDRAAGIENVNVRVENGDVYAEFTDRDGNVVECGHQRPAEIAARWSSGG